MDFLLFVVFAGAVFAGVSATVYQAMQNTARGEIEAWAKEKDYRLIDLKPGSALSVVVGSVTFDVAYETASGARENADATYSRAFGGLVGGLTVTPRGAFNYDRY